MNMKTFRVSPKWNRKVTRPKWSRIIQRSFWAILLIIFTTKMTPQTPLDPQSGFFPDFPGFSGTTPTGYRTTPVGCRGGNRYFEGVCGILEIPKIQTFDLPKIQRFHAHSKLFKKYRHCFHKYVWFSRIYLCFEDLGISKIYQDSTIVKFFEIARRSQLFWTHQMLNKTKN